MPQRVMCVVCQRPMMRFPSQIGKRIYCSQACRARGLTTSLPRRFWSRIELTATCWLWRGPFQRPGKYGVISLYKHPKKPRLYVMDLAHRVAWMLAIGPIPAGMQVCHHCDNPPCVRPDHLFLGTQQDNIADKMAKQRHPRGEQSVMTHLTTEQVQEILALRGIVSQKDIARQFGISPSTVGAIHRRENWNHIAMVSFEELAD